VRIGTPALATRGFGETEFTEVADIIAHTLMPNPDISALQGRVAQLTQAWPLYPELS
jgi:glycine hydroxymethyltransferase